MANASSVAAWTNTVKVWDADKGTETLTLKGHTEQVSSVSIQLGWQTIVSGSHDYTLKVWDTEKAPRFSR